LLLARASFPEVAQARPPGLSEAGWHAVRQTGSHEFGLMSTHPSAMESKSTPVRPGHLECVGKLCPRCRSSSNRGSNLPCRQGGRRRRLHSASSSKQARCRRLGGANACCKARRTVHVRRHRLSAQARTAFEVPLQTPRAHLSARRPCSVCQYFAGPASKTQCSVLSAIQRAAARPRSVLARP
jgi:hypothetical protein